MGLRPVPRRFASVVRLHLANPFTIVVTPRPALGIIFVANLVIWLLGRADTPTDAETVANVSRSLQDDGASRWTSGDLMVVAIQAMRHLRIATHLIRRRATPRA